MNNIEIIKCLADDSRRQIVSGLMREPMYVELMAERLGLSPSTVSFHLKKLEAAGVVASRKEQYYTMYSLNGDILDKPLREFLAPEAEAGSEEARREEQYRLKVLKTFMPDGVVTQLPVQRKKRNIVLEEILKDFEPGRDYTEKEVNLIISEHYEDFCFVRRGFVEEGWMEREHGVYRRSV